jgi:hypothetical protein
MSKLFLGVDWGTHSSKWSCSVGDRDYLRRMPTFYSELLHENGELTFAPSEERWAKSEDNLRRSLKGVLIHDPLGASFWNSVREDTGTSLGEAVTFSLCCLLADAKRQISTHTEVKEFADVELGFSFPNWVVEQGRSAKAASKHFQEAVAVAVELMCRFGVDDLPRPDRPFKISEWRAQVKEVLSAIPANNDSPLTVENITRRSFHSRDESIRYRFLMESGAAGLPYLRALKLEGRPGLAGLSKLLVVDVGAGSTDVGYMLRVQHIKTAKENLYFFPPAPSFNVAGNELTNDIIHYHRAKGEPMTWARAEAQKLQTTNWAQLPFVDTWKKRICGHVWEYVCGIPDFRWLPVPVPLNVVLTGGSGLVSGLSTAVKEAVLSALEVRQVPLATLQSVVIRGDHLPHLNFAAEADYAKRAVCLGAADRDKPGFRYMEKMDAPFKVQVAANRWV